MKALVDSRDSSPRLSPLLIPRAASERAPTPDTSERPRATLQTQRSHENLTSFSSSLKSSHLSLGGPKSPHLAPHLRYQDSQDPSPIGRIASVHAEHVTDDSTRQDRPLIRSSSEYPRFMKKKKSSTSLVLPKLHRSESGGSFLGMTRLHTPKLSFPSSKKPSVGPGSARVDSHGMDSSGGGGARGTGTVKVSEHTDLDAGESAVVSTAESTTENEEEDDNYASDTDTDNDNNDDGDEDGLERSLDELMTRTVDRGRRLSRGNRKDAGLPSSMSRRDLKLIHEVARKLNSVPHQSRVRKLNSIHGSTTKIMESKVFKKNRWDWNTLPCFGATALRKEEGYNTIMIPIDGQFKEIKYDPNYNSKLDWMNIFITFNTETKPKDCLIYAKKRLLSYTEYFTNYLKFTKYTNYKNDMTKDGSTKGSKAGTPTTDKSLLLPKYYKDSMETQKIICLWYAQIHKFLLPTHSILFSTEAIQKIVQQKSLCRDPTSAIDSAPLFLKPAGSSSGTNSPSSSNGSVYGVELSHAPRNLLDEIDVLLLRAHNTPEFGWQLAFDEPNLTICDYDLNVLPFNNFNNADSEKMISLWKAGIKKYEYHKTAVVLSDERYLKRVTNENAAEYMVDCMDRKLVDETASAPYHMAAHTEGYLGHRQELNSNSNDPTRPLNVSEDRIDGDAFSSEYRSSISMNNTPSPSQPNVAPAKSASQAEYDLFGAVAAAAASIANQSGSSLGTDSKRKKSLSKPNRKSGFVNFFRRKHSSNSSAQPQEDQASHPPPPSQLLQRPQSQSLPQQQALQERLVQPQPQLNHQQAGQAIPRHSTSTLNVRSFHVTPVQFSRSIPTPSPTELAATGTSTPSATPSLTSLRASSDTPELSSAYYSRFGSEELQNEWLVDHFCKILSNYRRVNIPTQYYFPKGVVHHRAERKQSKTKDPDIDLSSHFNKDLLKLRLPFPSNSIPCVHCPWLWSMLQRSKWLPLAKEMFRCLMPEGYALSIVADMAVSNSEVGLKTPVDEVKFPTSAERNRLVDSMCITAISKGLHVHPTKVLTKTFQDAGFINVKALILTFKTGDLKNDMGCIGELISTMAWYYMFWTYMGESDIPPGVDPTTLLERYVSEHWNKVDDSSGCFRVIFVEGQKPKRKAS